MFGDYPFIYWALRDTKCMMDTWALDPATGQDSASSAVLRPMTGSKAVDEFLPGVVPVFKPLLDSLTDLGYNDENLVRPQAYKGTACSQEMTIL